MSDGAKLKSILREKNSNIRKVSLAAGISPTTLYSIVNEDRKINIELAIPIAKVLDIEVSEICSSADLLFSIMKK